MLKKQKQKKTVSQEEPCTTPDLNADKNISSTQT